ncbi:phosphonoacetaldehyde reductase [Stackebrandtia nassauensis]|uniref:Iron-containing alcohol dehydrogenase n=1 Tax=Stackebrandtia nassauensis (strain DSM 44728 / CIP 108903 / NRRL B-16338 / NBRC 102104 / LLR-40K-21) TaxID=446470 RepID=D3PXW4_STANL|nr:phosphonoacetaldehyde reductase [Stackebrandtia nassauensis]ADD45293.1 iron-containing alcohol dehydrogenase [Stackebrandtia nassauensis DSM 44728]
MTLPDDRDVRFGDDAILDTWQLVSKLDGKRAVLICGQHAFDASGANRCLDELTKVAEVRRWSEFHPNTDAADLIHGLRVVEEFKPDLVLGVGGGSAMDMAKLLCAYQGITDAEQLHAAIRTGAAITERRLKLVLAPTTSGSGSEATHFAVVYIGNDKYSIAGPAMLPDTVILDPKLTLTASPYQRATSGIDALAQATESLWASGASDASRGFARAAIDLLVPALPEFVNNPSSEVAGRMAQGSHLAGRAIDVSKTTAAHALSYGFTKSYGVSHGHAVALTLGAFIEAHAKATPDNLQPSVDPATHAEGMRTLLAAFGAADAADARARFDAIAEECGLPLKLAEHGITTREQVADLASRVNVERLGNNPVVFTKEQLTELVAAGLSG